MHEGTSYIGIANTSVTNEPFGILQADRRQHLYAIGKSGSGKTTLLRNLIIQDIAAGRGLAVLDPHGDLAEELLDHIPPRRMHEVVYFNPADLEHPIGFNLLGAVAPDERSLVASSVVSTFRHLWAQSWGPRLEYVLFNTVAALLDFPMGPGATLLGVPRMLLDSDYRQHVVKHVRDPKVRSFWTEEFASWDARFSAEVVSPVLNKVGQFLSSPIVRNIVGQVRSTIDVRFMMDNRRILIANLSKGQLGEERANLLGSLLVTSFYLAALRRSGTPEAERADFQLYLDEFHNFTTDAFASILSEARKYRLCLTIAHQYIGQLSEEVRAAVLGNVGTLVAFRLGNEDAEALAGEFAPRSVASLRELGQREICVRLLRNGEVLDPFGARTLPPLENHHGRRESVIAQSRQRYSRRRDDVENKITRWLTAKPPSTGSGATPARRRR